MLNKIKLTPRLSCRLLWQVDWCLWCSSLWRSFLRGCCFGCCSCCLGCIRLVPNPGTSDHNRHTIILHIFFLINLLLHVLELCPKHSHFLYFTVLALFPFWSSPSSPVLFQHDLPTPLFIVRVTITDKSS